LKKREGKKKKKKFRMKEKEKKKKVTPGLLPFTLQIMTADP
jgi:hypothetical protein